jgi:hypothetical protein
MEGCESGQAGRSHGPHLSLVGSRPLGPSMAPPRTRRHPPSPGQSSLCRWLQPGRQWEAAGAPPALAGPLVRQRRPVALPAQRLHRQAAPAACRRLCVGVGAVPAAGRPAPAARCQLLHAQQDRHPLLSTPARCRGQRRGAGMWSCEAADSGPARCSMMQPCIAGTQPTWGPRGGTHSEPNIFPCNRDNRPAAFAVNCVGLPRRGTAALLPRRCAAAGPRSR